MNKKIKTGKIITVGYEQQAYEGAVPIFHPFHPLLRSSDHNHEM